MQPTQKTTYGIFQEKIENGCKKDRVLLVIAAIAALGFAALSIYATYFGMTAPHSGWQKAVYILSAFGCAASLVAVPLAMMILCAASAYRSPQNPKIQTDVNDTDLFQDL